MTMFSQQGAAWIPHREEALNLRKELPVGNYTVKKEEMTGQFFLEKIDSFRVPDVLYGNITKQTSRIMRTFAERTGSTGVLLAGEKGSGKTLLSKNVCNELAKVGVPSIVINHPWYGDRFNAFLQSITQPCIVVFDEFEKVYGREEQEKLLTLFDGVFSSKKLFLLTCNNEYRVDHHMRNRPGRIYYFVMFDSLAEEFIREYCEDNLLDQSYVEQVVQASKLFSRFNFDMLQSLIEEMNRFDEAPVDALAMLNAKPEHDDGGKYRMTVLYENVPYTGAQLDPEYYNGNPFDGDGIGVRVELSSETEETEVPANTSALVRTAMRMAAKENERVYLEFEPHDFVRFDPDSETFVFQNEKGALMLQKVRARSRLNMFAV